MASGIVYAFLPLYAVGALGATEGAAARLLTWCHPVDRTSALNPNSQRPPPPTKPTPKPHNLVGTPAVASTLPFPQPHQALTLHPAHDPKPDPDPALALTRLLVGGCAGGAGMGLVRDYTSQRTVVVLTGLLNLLAAAAVLGWAWHEVGVTKWLTLHSFGPLVFILGASMEATWTIHVSVFQLRYGGHVHAATLVGVTDFFSFAFKAPFIFLVGAPFPTHVPPCHPVALSRRCVAPVFLPASRLHIPSYPSPPTPLHPALPTQPTTSNLVPPTCTRPDRPTLRCMPRFRPCTQARLSSGTSTASLWPSSPAAC